jgi:methionyl-tRNA synthetase
MPRFYLTTAIDYANGDPDLGHALEKIGAARVGLAKNRAGRDSVRFEFTAAAWTTTP